jgi:hypothetical protein
VTGGAISHPAKGSPPSSSGSLTPPTSQVSQSPPSQSPPAHKDLVALPQHAQDYLALLSTATNAVSTTATIAAVSISGFGALLTVLAVVGWHSIKWDVIKRANKAIDQHLRSDHFRNMLEAAVSSTVSAKIGGAIIVQTPQGAGDPSGGIAPKPPQGGQGNG